MLWHGCHTYTRIEVYYIMYVCIDCECYALGVHASRHCWAGARRGIISHKCAVSAMQCIRMYALDAEGLFRSQYPTHRRAGVGNEFRYHNVCNVQYTVHNSQCAV